MHLRHLRLLDFRSWPLLELELEPGVTTLVGRNGHGKTNVLEAVGGRLTVGDQPGQERDPLPGEDQRDRGHPEPKNQHPVHSHSQRRARAPGVRRVRPEDKGIPGPADAPPV